MENEYICTLLYLPCSLHEQQHLWYWTLLVTNILYMKRSHDVTSMFSTYATIHTLPHTRALSISAQWGFKLWTPCSSDWAPPIGLQNMDTGLSKGMANKFTTEKEPVCEASAHSSMQLNYSQPLNPISLEKKAGLEFMYVTRHTQLPPTWLTDFYS